MSLSPGTRLGNCDLTALLGYRDNWAPDSRYSDGRVLSIDATAVRLAVCLATAGSAACWATAEPVSSPRLAKEAFGGTASAGPRPLRRDGSRVRTEPHYWVRFLVGVGPSGKSA